MILFCIDAIPAFKNITISLMPGEFIILNLPPGFRTKPEWIMMSLLIPSKLTATSQKKYFDYVVENELNPLVTTGIRHPGGTARVLVFGSSLDLPGRDKFFQLRGG